MSVSLSSLFWKEYLSLFSKKHIDYIPALNAYAKSSLGKYLPGNVGHYASRQIFGAAMGIKQTHLALASILEILWSAGATFFLAIIFAGRELFDLIQKRFPGMSIPLFIAVILIAGCALLAVLLIIFRKHPYFISLILFLKDIRFWVLSGANILYCGFISVLLGMFLVFLIGMIGNIPMTTYNVFLIITAFTTSWLIGFITPGVPGGIGLREAMLVLMLSPYFPREIILTSAVMQRFSMVLGDVLAWVFSIILGKWGTMKERRL
jgi:hypothetical protein